MYTLSRGDLWLTIFVSCVYGRTPSRIGSLFNSQAPVHFCQLCVWSHTVISGRWWIRLDLLQVSYDNSLQIARGFLSFVDLKLNNCGWKPGNHGMRPGVCDTVCQRRGTVYLLLYSLAWVSFDTFVNTHTVTHVAAVMARPSVCGILILSCVLLSTHAQFPQICASNATTEEGICCPTPKGKATKFFKFCFRPEIMQNLQ